MESKRKNTLTLLLIIVIVIIIGIIGYLGYEVISGNIKESKSKEITDEFDRKVPTLTEEEIEEIIAREQAYSAEADENKNNANNAENSTLSNNSSSTSTSNSGSNSSGSSWRPSGSSGSSSSGLYINGLYVIGKIQIPATGVSCSIFTDTSVKALDSGVSVLTTANGLNQPGNTVIIGHNYRNRLFFSQNKNLELGNIVKIKDTSGLEVVYEIYKKFITNESDASFYQRDTAGKREITLSTCTDNGTKTGDRIIIFAKEK